MFELHIDPNADITSGSIPVSWCVDRDTLAALKTNNLLDPQVVIITAPKNNYTTGKETRVVAPLKDLMAYVSFKTPGENTVRAFISVHSHRNAKKIYLTKDRSRYAKTVLEPMEGIEFWGSSSGQDTVEDSHTFQYQSNVLTVDVPQECFAAPPPAWEVRWVNWLTISKVIDQCDYRRRRILAYTLQPFVLLFRQLWVLVAIFVAALIGARNFSLDYLLHPLTTEITGTEGIGFDICGGGTIFWRKAKEDDMPSSEFDAFHWTRKVWYAVKKAWALPFMPVILIPILVLGYYHKLLIVGGSLGIIGLVVLTIGFFATGGFYALVEWITAPTSAWYDNEKDVVEVICTGEVKSVKTLKHKSIRLRFQDVKNKMCKPFAG